MKMLHLNHAYKSDGAEKVARQLYYGMSEYA